MSESELEALRVAHQALLGRVAELERSLELILDVVRDALNGLSK